MHAALRLIFGALLVAMICAAPIRSARAQPKHTDASHDGAHDFDFNLGTWRTHITRLEHPLSGAKHWVTMDGTVVVSKVWNGRAQVEEIEADGNGTHFEGMTLFLYNPQSHQWSLDFANGREGALQTPAIGEFRNGRGEFFDQETLDGRTVLLRVTWSNISPNTHHFEQAFSVDGGKTWESNFTANLTRAPEGTATTAPPLEDIAGQHDFDFQLGQWAIHMKRLTQPLTGSDAWTELDGTVAVRKLWNGRANLAEISTSGPSGSLEFLSLRLFDPRSQQWTLNFASSKNGTFGTPMTGTFKNGRGEFTDQETFNGRMIWVRFVFDQIQSGSHRDEQSFSDDGGKTWEINWINESKPAH